MAAVGITVAVMAAVGCGQEEEDPPEPPQFANPSITCADSQDPDVDGQIITAVSLEVTDPDRDLVTDEGKLEGTFDSLPITLTDEDADQRFEWQPSDMENRIRCSGEHHLVVQATDAEGNEATFDERITQDGAS